MLPLHSLGGGSAAFLNFQAQQAQAHAEALLPHFEVAVLNGLASLDVRLEQLAATLQAAAALGLSAAVAKPQGAGGREPLPEAPEVPRSGPVALLANQSEQVMVPSVRPALWGFDQNHGVEAGPASALWMDALRTGAQEALLPPPPPPRLEAGAPSLGPAGPTTPVQDVTGWPRVLEPAQATSPSLAPQGAPPSAGDPLLNRLKLEPAQVSAGSLAGDAVLNRLRSWDSLKGSPQNDATLNRLRTWESAAQVSECSEARRPSWAPTASEHWDFAWGRRISTLGATISNVPSGSRNTAARAARARAREEALRRSASTEEAVAPKASKRSILAFALKGSLPKGFRPSPSSIMLGSTHGSDEQDKEPEDADEDEDTEPDARGRRQDYRRGSLHSASAETLNSLFSIESIPENEVALDNVPPRSWRSFSGSRSVVFSAARTAFDATLGDGSPRRSNSGPSRSLGRLLKQLKHQDEAVPVSMRAHVWTFLEATENHFLAGRYARFMTLLMVISVLLTFFQACNLELMSEFLNSVLVMVLDACFATEVLVRMAVCPSLWRFLQNPYNIIDIVAAVTSLVSRSVVGFGLGDERDSLTGFMLLCGAPVLRLCRMLRRFQTFHLLLDVAGTASEALPVLMFVFVLILMTFSSLIFLVEPRTNIDSLPKAMWLTIVTMTTVGYGDVVPQTTAGKAIVAVLVVVCLLYMSMPIGILGSEFTRTWQNRHRVVILRRTRERLDQWGFQATDMPKLFRHFAKINEQDTCLSLPEFRRMITQVRLGLTEEAVIRLFECLDYEATGTVQERDFVKAVYPSEFYKVYGEARPSLLQAEAFSGTNHRDSTQAPADLNGH